MATLRSDLRDSTPSLVIPKKDLSGTDYVTRGTYAVVDTSDPTDRPSRSRSVTRAFAENDRPLKTVEVARLAANFVLLWFAANWTVNAALVYTSVSSTTILSSMSGFFTLILGVMLGVEKFSWSRLIVVATSIGGVVLVSKSDNEYAAMPTPEKTSNGKPLLGNFLALSSAALYAVYVMLMKVKVKDENRVDMQLFFGFVGAINMLCFWPVGFLLHYTGIEPFVLPPTRKMWISVVVNALCTFVSDYIYMLAMLKTSPLVVTLGLSLTLPVAMIGDIIKGVRMPFISLIGAGLVLSSFGVLSWVEQANE